MWTSGPSGHIPQIQTGKKLLPLNGIGFDGADMLRLIKKIFLWNFKKFG
jgi:hypothetical protein